MNGRSPYQIKGQWLNPSRNKVNVFKSKYIWYDPSDYIDVEEITVKTDPQNIDNYYMDISFLPDQA
ncbi:MAG: hypothetical protein ACLFUI_07845 [Halanaerobiales bacterium]